MGLPAVQADRKEPATVEDEAEVPAPVPHSPALRQGQTGLGGLQEEAGLPFIEPMKAETLSKQSSHISHKYLSSSRRLQYPHIPSRVAYSAMAGPPAAEHSFMQLFPHMSHTMSSSSSFRTFLNFLIFPRGPVLGLDHLPYQVPVGAAVQHLEEDGGATVF